MTSKATLLRDKTVEGYVPADTIPDIPIYMPRDRAWAEANTRGPLSRLRVRITIEQLEEDLDQ